MPKLTLLLLTENCNNPQEFYMDVFLYLGLMFLICVPFILLVRQKKGGKTVDLIEAMH